MTAKINRNENENGENGFVQRLNNLEVNKEYIFSSIGRKETQSGYPVIYLFSESDRPVMIYETSKAGQEFLKNFDRLKKVVFGVTFSSYHSERFDKEVYQVDKIRYVEDKPDDAKHETILEGF